MVKTVLSLFFLATLLSAQELFEKIHSLVGQDTFKKHSKLISVLFENENSYMKSSSVDMVKVAKTLEENGLLKLDFPASKEVSLTFKYDGENPLFFLKIMNDVLRNIGLTFILTREASLTKDGFIWKISYSSKSVVDPVLLANRLERVGAEVLDIERYNETDWMYRVGVQDARIVAKTVLPEESVDIVRPIRVIWIDVGKVKRLIIREKPGSHWYPDVVVYDKMLRILSLKQKDARTRYMSISLSADAKYVKINDRFTLENLRNGLKLTAKGER